MKEQTKDELGRFPSHTTKLFSLIRNPKIRTVLLGSALAVFLVLSYIENMAFFEYFGYLLANPPIAVIIVFTHNVLVVSLILLSMTFYVELVIHFFKPRRFDRIVLEHPRPFAAVYTLIVILISIFRASTIIFGSVMLNALAFIVILSLPNAIVEGYGVFLTIQKTLSRNMTLRDLSTVCVLLLVSAILEVGLSQALLSTAA